VVVVVDHKLLHAPCSVNAFTTDDFANQVFPEHTLFGQKALKTRAVARVAAFEWQVQKNHPQGSATMKTIRNLSMSMLLTQAADVRLILDSRIVVLLLTSDSSPQPT
jgi:hypothetical protein